MNHILIAIKDNAVQAFQEIGQCRTKGEAIRAFTDAVNNPTNKQLHQHPEDFDLYLVGTYNSQEGVVTRSTPTGTPELIIRGVEVKTK